MSLPYYTNENMTLALNEYVTNVTINKNNIKLLDNDKYLFSKIEEISGKIPPDIYNIFNNVYSTIYSNSSNWNDAYNITLSSHDEWVKIISTDVTHTLLTSGIPSWINDGELSSNHYLNYGFKINVSDNGILNQTHEYIPTSKTIIEAIQNSIHPDWVSQIGEVTHDHISIWDSRYKIKDSGIHIADVITGYMDLGDGCSIINSIDNQRLKVKSISLFNSLTGNCSFNNNDEILIGSRSKYSVDIVSDYFQLLNDEENPGPFKFYGTKVDNTKGYQQILITNSLEFNNEAIQLVNDNASPGSYKYYGTNNIGTKGWFDAYTLIYVRELYMLDSNYPPAYGRISVIRDSNPTSDGLNIGSFPPNCDIPIVADASTSGRSFSTWEVVEGVGISFAGGNLTNANTTIRLYGSNIVKIRPIFV